MVRIVHTGDIHLDTAFAGVPGGVAQRRKEELRETFLRIVDSAREYGADIFIIAGDLLESKYASGETMQFLKECFSRIPETAVFLAPGNHDYLSEESPYHGIDLGGNVHIFGDRLEAVKVKDTTVYGYGFSSRFVSESALPSVRIHNGEGPGILIMHGDVATESDYNPISISALSGSGITYAALGHIHQYSGILYAGHTAYAYCGIPEGRRFNEANECGYIRGEISADKVDLSFVPIAKRQYITLEVDITGLDTIEAIRQKIKSFLKPENLYKVVLCGEMAASLYIDTALLEKELLYDCFYIKVKDHTALMGSAANESVLAKLFAERLSKACDAVSKKALRFGLEALRGQKR